MPNRTVTYHGITRTVSEWAREYSMNPDTLFQRLNAGWKITEALKTPVRHPASGVQSHCDTIRQKYDKLLSTGNIHSDWLDYPAFRDWLIQNGYRPGYIISRLDRTALWGPDNCQVVRDPKVYIRPQRASERTAEYNGVSMTLSDWAAILGMNRGTLYQRLEHGWTMEQIVSKPVREYYQPRRNGK